MKKFNKAIAILCLIMAMTWIFPDNFFANQMVGLAKSKSNNVSSVPVEPTGELAISLKPSPSNPPDKNDLPNAGDATTDYQNSVKPYDPDKTRITGEVKEKRSKYTKTFRKEDGVFEAAIYNSAVHYKKEDGSWVEVDNTLEEIQDYKGNTLYKTKNNGYMTVTLDPKGNSRSLVSIKKGAHSIEWGFKNSKSGSKISLHDDTATLKNRLNHNAQKRMVDKVMSHVKYVDIIDDASVEYYIEPQKVKEDIIVKKYTPNFSVSFNLLTDLKVKQLENGMTALCDMETKIFYILPPIMNDSAEGESTDIQMNFKQTKQGYTVTLIPNDEWMQNAQYPVVIDPIIQTDLNVNNIRDSYVSEKYPTSNYQTSSSIRVGWSSSYDRLYGYLKYSDIPTLSAADVVVSAYTGLKRSESYTGDYQFSLHKVTSNWDSSTITWSNKASYDSTVQDYHIINPTNTPADSIFYWDVTEIVRYWYQNNNYGLMIKGESTTGGYRKFYSSDSTYTTYRPTTYIQYVNTSGLESYWSYETLDAGRAGTANINAFTGNLVVNHSDIGTEGNRLPVFISHVYNTNTKDDNIGYGKGWRLNYAQTIAFELISGTNYYKYTDADGTIHYFKENGSVYEDESGQERTLTIDTGSTSARYIIRDKKDNELQFDDAGYLRIIKDRNANEINISYNSGKIGQITDGTGRIYSFDYNGSGYLSTITASGNRVMTYTYDGSARLTGIEYPDSKQTTYAYDADNCITRMENFDGYRLDFTFISGSPKRVSTVSESHFDGTTTDGGDLSFVYEDKQTKITDHLANVNIFQFNQYGNTVNIQDDKGRATFYKYYNPDATVTGGTEKYGKNKLFLSSRLQEPVINYVKNHSFEQSTDWTVYNHENDTGSNGRTTSQSYIGSNSMQITSTQSTGSKFQYQSMTLEKGKTYTISGWIKTADVVSSSGGALISFKYKDSTDAYQYIYGESVTGSTDWQRHSLTITLPSDLTTTTVDARVMLLSSTGTAYFDGIQVEESSVPNRYNLVENSDMTYYDGGTGIPTFWYENPYTETGDTRTTDSGIRGNLSDSCYKFDGNVTKNKDIYQTIYVNGGAGDVFSFGGWGKGDSVPIDTLTGNYDRRFAVRADIRNGTTILKTVYAWFNTFSNEWQFVSDRIVAPSTYDRVVLILTYKNNENTCYFDGIQLYKEEFGQSYTYDDDGNVISTTDLVEQQSKWDYDSNNDLIEYIAPDGSATVKYDFKYDTNHNMTEAKTPEGVYNKITYDSYGNALTATVQDADTSPTEYVSSSATYITGGNYVDYVTDPSGNKVDYSYDTATGFLESVTDPDSQTISYTYDNSNMGFLTKASTMVDSTTYENSYGYTDDRLTSITHNGFSYTINYNPFGQMTEVKVGTQILAQYDFEGDYAGEKDSYLLEKITYGNDDVSNHQTVSYGYDDRYRVNEVFYDDENTPRYHYAYNNSGQIGMVQDNENNVTVRYWYDLAERLMCTTEEFDTFNRSHKYIYDVDNCVTDFDEIVDGATYTVDYTYDNDNRIDDITYGSGEAVDYVYDGIGRMDYYDLETGTTDYRVSYTYLDGSGGSSTMKVNSISQGGTTYTYTYDDCGRILSVSDGKNTVSYEYDFLGQLIRVNDQVADDTWVYAYDVGGNITSKTKYDYTIGTVGVVEDTISYTYDATWKDKLTAYNGTTITSDEIGNVINDGTYTYTWEAGRQLASMSDGNTTYSFKYNDDGLRTEKYDGTTRTNYYWSGDKITHITKGSDIYHFYYDVVGRPQVMDYNGTQYYYKHNLQGDIIGLINTSGVEVVSYTYDAWGQQLTCIGTLASTLGVDNPFRYRGYLYDSETGLYYLQSRYYNPEWGRFVSTDGADVLDGANDHMLENNLFAYCLNNPVNMMDEDGQWPSWATKVLIGVAVIAVCAVITLATGGAGAGVAGFIAAGALKGAVIGAATGAAIGASTSAVNHRLSTGSWKGAGSAALEGGADGFMKGSITGAISGGGGRALQALRNTRVGTSSLLPKSKSMSSMTKVRNGRVAQTRFYNARGKAYYDLDYDMFPKKGHSIIHGHTVNFAKTPPRSNPINIINNWWKIWKLH